MRVRHSHVAPLFIHDCVDRHQGRGYNAPIKAPSGSAATLPRLSWLAGIEKQAERQYWRSDRPAREGRVPRPFDSRGKPNIPTDTPLSQSEEIFEIDVSVAR